MYEFLEWLKEYLITDVKSNAELKVFNAYSAGHQVVLENLPELQLQIMDYADLEEFSSFAKENVSYLPIQINVFTGKLRINNSLRTAQESSIILGEEIKKSLNRLRESVVNPNLLRVRVMTVSPAMPFLQGQKAYMTAIRCEFQVKNPYISG